MGVQIGWKVDVNACMSCRACEMACKVEFDIQAGQGRRRRVIEKTVLDAGDKVRTFFISMACNQCEKPACVAACPIETRDPNTGRKALWKDETGAESDGVKGVVRVAPERCIGCRRCEWACPYGAPQFNPETERIHKCEMCWQRWGNSSMHVSRQKPACVVQCIGQALKADWVDTDPTVHYDFTPTDRFDILSISTDAKTAHGAAGEENDYVEYANAPDGSPNPHFASPGATVGTANDPGALRGTKYVADASLTRPALKIRNRVYVTRDGGGLE